ncbi:MAG: hypothetical protein M3Y13_15165, partial [Armatimonadota bacterium]|nr:hypothetical protein [Armatimonadota bacterium]
MARTETEIRAGAPPPGTGLGESKQGIRARALIFGAVGAAATAFLVTWAEMVLQTIKIGYLQFPPAALGLLLLAVALSRGLARISRRWNLTFSDLLVIYCMCLVGAMTSSHGLVEKMVPDLVFPKYGANNTNGWHDLYDRFLSHSLVAYDPTDGSPQNVVDSYYKKLHPGEALPWNLWLVPVLNWGLLAFLVLFAFLCLTAILRKQWVDSEKLAFPLAQLPLEIAGDQDRPSFFRNRLMWMGALVPVIIYAVKGLHQVQPTVPDITVQWNLSDYVTTPPWNQAAGEVYFILSFAAIGFFFLLPADVLFSIWFFFLVSRIEQVIMISFNQPMPGMPAYPPPLFIGYQTIGAYLVLSGYFFYVARPHLRRVWAAAIGREKGDDADEILPYRVAVWGLLGSILASAGWLCWNGMSLWLALFELIVCIFVVALVMARSTAEAGMLMTETTFRPIDLYRMVAPVHALGGSNLTMLAFFDNLFLRDQRGLLLTGMLDAARMTDGTRIRRRAFAGVLALGIGIAFAVAVPLNIYLPYHLGANGHMDQWMEQGSPGLTLNDYQQHFKGVALLPNGSSWQMPTFFGVGIIMTVFLTVMRTAFFWWPLHPLGYALSGSW